MKGGYICTSYFELLTQDKNDIKHTYLIKIYVQYKLDCTALKPNIAGQRAAFVKLEKHSET